MVKVGGAPGARPGRGEAGRRGSGTGSWRGWGAVPVVLPGVATAAGNALGSHQGRGEPGRRGAGVGGRGSGVRSWRSGGGHPSCALGGRHWGWTRAGSAPGAGSTRAARVETPIAVGGGRSQWEMG